MRVFHAALMALLLASPANAMISAKDPDPAVTQSIQVYNEQNEKLGEASVVLLNDAGKPEGVVVKMREMDATQIEVVVPVDRIRDASGDKRLVIAATKEELKAMPRLQDQPPGSRANSHK